MPPPLFPHPPPPFPPPHLPPFPLFLNPPSLPETGETDYTYEEEVPIKEEIVSYDYGPVEDDQGLDYEAAPTLDYTDQG